MVTPRAKAFHFRARDSWATGAVGAQPIALASGATLFVEARLDDRDALHAALGMPQGDRPGERDDAALVARAYERWGPTAHERLYGDFAVAHWDSSNRTLTLARDAIGVRALFYHFDGRSVRFATALHHLLAMPQVPRDLDDLALADFLAGTTGDSTQTLYRHILRVPAGGTATFREGSCRTATYWTLDAIPRLALRRDADYVDAARAMLDRAVASRLPAQGKVAAMLSGGFDSPAAAATAARLLGDRGLTAFTRISGAYNPYDRFDEKGFAGQVAAMHPNMDWIVIDALHQAPRDIDPGSEAARMGLPGNGFPTSWFEPVHQRAAAMGVHTLLSGSLGNGTLSWSGNALFQEQFRRGRWISALGAVRRRARRERRPALPLLRRELRAAVLPAGMARARAQRAAGHGWWRQMAALLPDFLDAVDFDAHANRPAHDNVRGIAMSGRERRWSMIRMEDRADKKAYERGQFPYLTLDPYADRRLAEFTLGVPEEQFQGQGRRRWLARRAFADRLPAALLDQDDRGRQVGEWYHLGNLRREHTAAAVERMALSPLASRVLDIAYLKSLVDTWPKDADVARATERQHRYVLHYSVAIGAFLEWVEARSD